MCSCAPDPRRNDSVFPSRPAFTLIELLVVMAIISILLALLIPALSAARDHAKALKSRAEIKTISEALELFRGENESDRTARETHGYPPSAMADDPAVAGTDQIGGAQWLVRYLMGKDLSGYAPRFNAPADLQDPNNPDEQVSWYEWNADGSPKVARIGPYLPPDTVKVVPTKDLPQATDNPAMGTNYEQQVIVDAFGYPILYYVANAIQAARKDAYLASIDGVRTAGIYTFKDNGLFTGLCSGTPSGGGGCMFPPWDFGGGTPHGIEYFGPDPNDPQALEAIGDNPQTFQCYILNKSIYEASKNSGIANAKPIAVPYRPDSFLLISAWRDGRFGTRDDPKNF